MSVDHLIQVVSREPLSLLLQVLEVEVVPAKLGMIVSRKKSFSAACLMQIPKPGLYGELLSMLADCSQSLRQGKMQQYNQKQLID